VVRLSKSGELHAIANVLNKLIASPIVAFSNLVRENKFRIRVNATPQPIIAAFRFVVFGKPASVAADILPLLVHFDSDTWQITKISVHVIRERFAGLTVNPLTWELR